MPRPRGSAPAVIVEIDERALDARGQWPWPRTVTADLLHAIAALRPAAIGVDILFTEPDRSSQGADAALAGALQRGKTVLGIAGIEAVDRRFPAPPQAAPVQVAGSGALKLRRFNGHLQSLHEIDRAAAGRGLLSAESSADRIVRRVPLVARVGNVTVPSLSVEMVRVAASVPVLRIENRGGEHVALRIGDLDLPLQSNGSFPIYFGAHDPARFISAEDLLAGKVRAEALQDKLVLVGVTGLGLLDYQATPLGERIPGVEVHAQILEQMFDGSFLHRPTGAAWIEAGILLAAGLLLVACVPAMRAWASALLLLAVLLAYAATGVLAFKSGILLNVAAPGFAVLLVFAALLAGTFAEADRQRRQLREAQARVAGELEAARRIQMGMLPEPKTVFAGETRFELDARLEPARTVGGDFYDCFMVDRHRLFFLVGDVSGKGLPASLFMALAKSLIKSIALRADDPDPGGVLTRANVEISRDNPESLFVTVFAGLLDIRTGGLGFSNAGHEPPIACRPGAAPEAIEHSGGPPLCVIDGFEYPTAHRVLEGRESVSVVTDGVTEAMNLKRDLYGSARLKALLASVALAAPQAVVEAIARDVAKFAAGAEPADDLTLLTVRWTGDVGAGLAAKDEDEIADLISAR
jgi:adenylate cyclase